MSDPVRDTIFALSSGRPPAAIAVIRISGPRAGAAVTALIGRVPEPRKAALARVRDPANGEVIDEALALWFPGPNSETGEDTAELQLHGGRAVVADVLATLGRIEGLRPAEAGEFTRRAFENGRIDLTAVEGLADLIGAETEAQRRQAYRQMKGLLGDRAETWRARLIEALALVEARIDFSDEADVPEDLIAPALEIARRLRDEIAEALAGATRGERLRDGLVVAIAGPPNAGKSTLLNRIARREVAIVSPHAGTTRDVIEVHLDLDGYPVTLLDTAGIRDSDDPVEQEGVRRARERAAGADLVLWVEDAGDPGNASGGLFSGEVIAPAGEAGESSDRAEAVGGADKAPAQGAAAAGWGGQTTEADRKFGLTSARNPSDPDASVETNFVEIVGGSTVRQDTPTLGPIPVSDATPMVWVLKNKVDLYNMDMNSISESEFISSDIVFVLSATLGLGIDKLITAISAFAASYFGLEPALITRERHRKALVTTQAALDRAQSEGAGGREDIIAEELRLAAQTLGRLSGRVDVEDILDAIFRDFCIGK